MPNLAKYIVFTKENDKNIIDISQIIELIKNKKSEIEKIEIYYNYIDTEIISGQLECQQNSLF